MVVIAASGLTFPGLSAAAESNTEKQIYLSGDVNLDGQLSIGDVTELQRGIAELTELSGLQTELARVDGKELSVQTATLIQKYIAEMDTGLPIGEPAGDENEGVVYTEKVMSYACVAGQVIAQQDKVTLSTAYPDVAFISDKDVPINSTSNVTGTASNSGVNVTITDLRSIAAATYDAEIKLTYKAKLANSAVMGYEGNENEVKFVYSNDPATTGTGESPTSKTKTFTLGITVNKTNSDGDALKGSTWLLKKGDDIVAEIDGADLSTFEWKGLDVGTYTLTETEAPNNYTKLEGKITVVIAATYSEQTDDDGTYSLATYTATVTGPQGYVTKTNGESDYANIQTGITSLNVKNFQKGALPSTGGVGLYVILGLAGAAFAGMVVVIIIKKRMSAKEK
ncbi:MAG: SpaA isopeptide-forming pilin-related protein [Ruminococcus sp.]|nr:SpaA isopeptide-forming pilin-related protein [Ruminococcus sp.]